MRKVIICILVLCLVCLSSLCMANQKINLATLNWDPYIGKHLPKNGFLSAIVDEAFEQAGYETKTNFLPWARALKMTQRGEFDAIYPCYFSVDREKNFLFSDELISSEIVFCTKKESNIKYTSLQDLKKYNIGTVRGFVYGKEFDSSSFLKKEEVASDLQNLKKLLHGRVDLIAIDKMVALSLIKNNPSIEGQINDINFLSPPIVINKMYVMFPKKLSDSMQKRKKFNESLQKMKYIKRVHEILMEFGLE